MRLFHAARLPATLLVGLLVAACGDAAITAPTPLARGVSAASGRSAAQLSVASVRWNRLARDLVASTRTDPPMAARYYAMLGVAQHRAVTAAQAADRGRDEPRRQLAVRAAVVGASAEVLAYAFGEHATLLRDLERADLDRLRTLDRRGDDLTVARQLGIDAARAVILRALTDGADAVWEPDVPVGAGKWFPSVPTEAPLRPLWGSVRPWLLEHGSQLRPPEPPAVGSAAFDAALAEVRRFSDTRTAEQLRIAVFWADGPGTPTPPGHWNAIASDLVERYHLNEERAAEMFALLNMALMDASIACWDAKYTYWLLRPSQADPTITTPVGLPDFPSYVSGHATFSGAAAALLGDVFPAERRTLNAMAAEAAMSRLYGGIHYRFDNDDGLSLGRRIGALAVARRGMRNAGGAERTLARASGPG